MYTYIYICIFIYIIQTASLELGRRSLSPACLTLQLGLQAAIVEARAHARKHVHMRGALLPLAYTIAY